MKKEVEAFLDKYSFNTIDGKLISIEEHEIYSVTNSNILKSFCQQKDVSFINLKDSIYRVKKKLGTNHSRYRFYLELLLTETIPNKDIILNLK